MAVIDIYARVSRASDTRMRSTDGQISDCTNIVVDRGDEVGEVFVDPSKSAWNPRVRRPGWEAEMARLESGAADGVIIFDLARFTRRPAEGERLIGAAERGLIVLDSESEYDLTTPNGKKQFRDQMNAAAYESDRLSTRVKRGKRIKARAGESNVSTRPFGFESGGVIERKAEADALREMAGRLLTGEDAFKLCRELNERGLLSSRGNPWKPPSLRVALMRPANVGDIAHLGTIVRQGVNPGILDRETFERVCAMYVARRRGTPTVNLATGFVKCADCGRGLHAKEQVGNPPYPNGAKARAYSCIKRDGGCGNRIDWLDLNTFLRDWALDAMSDPANAEAIETTARTVGDELSAVQAKIREITATAKEMADRLGRADIPLSVYDSFAGSMNEQLVKLHAHEKALILAMPERVRSAKVESRAVWARRWKAGDLSRQRGIVKTALAGRRFTVSAGSRFEPASERCVLARSAT